jgi:hypothetical protein
MQISLGALLATVLLCTTQAANAWDRCTLLTQREATKALNTPLKSGVAAGPFGSACHWSGKHSDNTYVQLQVIDNPSYWVPPPSGAGCKKISGIGRDAYMCPEQSGFVAATVTDKQVVAVSLAGGKASPEAAIELLRAVLRRAK